MDIFKFNSPTAPTKLEQGEVINNLKSKMWIERYRRHGEFTLVADVSSGLRDILPIGSMISHVDTTEVMIVENHEIIDDKTSPQEIKITGRGFESYFEHRVVGSNKDYSVTQSPTDYILLATYTWNQVVSMIRQHIYAEQLIDDDNAIPYVEVLHDVSGTSVSEERSIQRGDLYSRVIELLDVDDLGIKVVRPGPGSPLGAASPNIAVVIHAGTDRSSEVIFSHDTGEIESAEYLWSNKKLKNCALVSGRWVQVFVEGTATQYDRRVMFVEANDVDQAFDVMPAGADLTNVKNSLRQRGLQALAGQKALSLAKTEVSTIRNIKHYRYDYEVGDIITVSGDYNATAERRIEEYVEIEDENGYQGYPTLVSLDEGV